MGGIFVVNLRCWVLGSKDLLFCFVLSWMDGEMGGWMDELGGGGCRGMGDRWGDKEGGEGRGDG